VKSKIVKRNLINMASKVTSQFERQCVVSHQNYSVHQLLTFYTKTYYTDLIFSLVLVVMPHEKAEL